MGTDRKRTEGHQWAISGPSVGQHKGHQQLCEAFDKSVHQDTNSTTPSHTFRWFGKIGRARQKGHQQLCEAFQKVNFQKTKAKQLDETFAQSGRAISIRCYGGSEPGTRAISIQCYGGSEAGTRCPLVGSDSGRASLDGVFQK